MTEKLKPRTASTDEIRNIIESVAATAKQGNGYFQTLEVKQALIDAGINPKSVKWEKILRSMYHIDDLAGTTRSKPYNALNPIIMAPETPDTMLGAPNLDIGPVSKNIDASYRPDGQKSGGISQKNPKNLGIKN